MIALRFTLLPALLAMLVATPGPGHAQEAKELGQFGDWTAYVSGAGNARYCYMVSTPRQATLRDRRGDIFYLVWNRPARQEYDVVQVDIGYAFKENSQAVIKIGDVEWKLFTNEGNAWTYTSEEHGQIVEAMRAGLEMTVTGLSSRDNPTTDLYSLRGSTAAHNAITKACPR